MLDAVTDDFERINALIGSEDRERLERHASSIREIEMRLRNGASIGEHCSVADLGEPIDYNRPEDFPQVAQSQDNNLSVSLLNPFGIADSTFGNPMFTTGPVPNLT